MIKVKKEGLIGKYFHSTYKDGKIKEQGLIIDKIAFDSYLCQMYDWIMGEPSTQEIKTLDEMKSYKFYDDHAIWKKIGDKSMK